MLIRVITVIRARSRRTLIVFRAPEKMIKLVLLLTLAGKITGLSERPKYSPIILIAETRFVLLYYFFSLLHIFFFNSERVKTVKIKKFLIMS